MTLPSDLDSIDFAILKAIALQPKISTREIQETIFLSRVQVLRRLKQLEKSNLITKTDGTPGQAFHYTLSSNLTPEDIEQFITQRLGSVDNST